MPIVDPDPHSTRAIARQVQESKEMPHDEFLVKWKRWSETKNPKILHEIADANSGMVLKLANRASERYGIGLADAFQAGWIALERAIRKYKPERGCKLITSAWWIVKRGIAEEKRGMQTVRVHQRTESKLDDLVSMRAELGREPSVDELAVRLEWQPSTVHQLFDLYATRVIGSMQQSIDGAEENLVQDVIPAASRGGSAISEELAKNIVTISAGLNERERAIFVGIFLAPILGHEQVTEVQIGKLFGITRERVRQIKEGLRERLKIRCRQVFDIRLASD